jgi:hypothetical protein
MDEQDTVEAALRASYRAQRDAKTRTVPTH